jgi:hypothetical protein
MHDTGKVLAGLAIFVLLVTSPLWMNALSSEGPERPDLTLPPNGAAECVRDVEFMRASHMDLLNTWRDEVVRHDERWEMVKMDGVERRLAKSLTGTCLDCHSNKDEFCDTCHTYAAVSPTCWTCHVVPKEAQHG